MVQFLKKSGFNTDLRPIHIGVSLLILFFSGCKNKYPKDILKPEEIKPVLFDVMVATEMRQLDTTAAVRQHLRDSITLEVQRVLAAHKIDDSLYFRSMAFYEAHPDYLKKLLDSTRAYGSRLQDSLQKKSFTTPDTAQKAKTPLHSPKPRADTAASAAKTAENPTVKDTAGVPVEKVKKPTQKKK